ncbi:MAG: hypothetical protein IKN53_04505, partial [Oscillibacter sp.]|nr:hypothetical protein [Oscillibacter sp.]
MRKIFAALLTLALLIGLVPAAQATTPAPELGLAYEVDFRGTDGIFAPAGVSGNYTGYEFTPSLDGTELTVVGNDYAADGAGTASQSYWGGAIRGFDADEECKYTLTYKIKNNSTKANSQFALGGWITVPTGTAKFWNVTATYQSAQTNVLSLMNGNGDTVAASSASKLAMRDDADLDGDGFMDVKIEYDGPNGTMTVYTMIGGAWTELASRSITVGEGNEFGLMLYLYRTGAINFTLKDVKVYANGGRFATDLDLAYTADFRGDDVFSPAGVYGNYAGYTFAPSLDGSSLSVTGSDYAADGAGTAGVTYWGGAIRGFVTNASSRYMMTYKIKNESEKANSQFALGGWITVPSGSSPKFWNVTASYNSAYANVLSLLNGNADTVAADAAAKTAMRDSADRDEDGFMDVRIDYDGPNGTMTLYTRIDGVWTALVSRAIEAGESDSFGLMLYLYRTGAIKFTLKDLNVYAEAGNVPTDMHLVYEFDFSGSDPYYTPVGVSGNAAGYTFTPSAGGSALTVVGNDYAADGAGTEGATFWGARVKGLAADLTARYTLTYKIKNNSTKANSQFGVGGWITDTTKFWNVWATYNSTAANMLSTVNGNAEIVAAPAAARTAMRDDADRDANGFLDMKLEYDGPGGTMTVYTMIGGAWSPLVSRAIAVNDSDRFGLMFYLYRTGAINFTIKDAKIYANGNREPSLEEDFGGGEISGYSWVKKEFTLGEVKPRYGMEKLLSAENVTPEAVFRNRMDAFWAKIPYASSPAVSFAKKFPAAERNYEEFYVTFVAAIGAGDSALQNNLGKIKLEYTTDGVTWQDCGAAFTAAPTGDAICLASDVPYDANDNNGYDFSGVATIPSYRFTSAKFSAPHVRNIRLTPMYGAAGSGYFRLMNLYVWGVTDEYTGVPHLGGNLNPTVEKTTVAGTTSYELYRTDFSTLDSWVTNAITYAVGSKVNYGGDLHPQAYFSVNCPVYYTDPSTSKNSYTFPTTDGGCLRLYSPNMTLDPSLYDAINVELDYFRLSGQNDETPNLHLGYSTDNGLTWTRIDVDPATTAGTPAVSSEGATTYHTTLNVKPYLPAGPVTNIVVLPYDESYWYEVMNWGSFDATHREDGPLLGSKGAFRILNFSITGTSTSDSVAAVSVPVYKKDYDSTVIQTMINAAASAGQTECVIPSINPRTGTNVWTISKTILVPSNMTLYIDNCTFRFENYCLCHMIENSGASKLNQTTGDEQENIHIVGVGDAILQGGLFNGISSTLIQKSGRTTWSNILLLLQNVNGFSVENLRVEESRFWSVCLYYCRNGSVEHMDYFNSRKVQEYNGVEIWEQDGIDIRNGCENILVNDVTGRTGDDSVAFNAIRPLRYAVSDKSGDVRNVTVTNVATKLARLRMNVRFTASNGWKIHDVLVDGVHDTKTEFGGKLSTATVLLGDDNPGYAAESLMEAGDIYNIHLRNIDSNTTRAIYVLKTKEGVELVRNTDWSYEAGTCSNAYGTHVVVSKGSLYSGTASGVVCSHDYTAQPDNTNYLRGLNPSASLLTWKKCSICNSVSCLGEIQEDFITSASIDMGEDITFHVYATLTPAQAARVTRMDFTMDTADSNPNKAQSVPLASAT